MRGAFHKHGRVPARAGTTGPLRQGLTLGSLFPHQLLFQIAATLPSQGPGGQVSGKTLHPTWGPLPSPPQATPWRFRPEGWCCEAPDQTGGRKPWDLCSSRDVESPRAHLEGPAPALCQDSFLHLPVCWARQACPCHVPSPALVATVTQAACPWRSAGSGFGGRNLRDCTSGD